MERQKSIDTSQPTGRVSLRRAISISSMNVTKQDLPLGMRRHSVLVPDKQADVLKLGGSLL